MRNLLKVLVSIRFYLLAVLGILLYLAISQLHLSLWYVLLGGVVLGVLFGKVFCRWFCAVGVVMERL